MDGAADGMGWLNAYLPIVKVTAIFTRLSDTARSLRDGTETRTLTQLRADIFCDVLLDDEVEGDGLRGSGSLASPPRSARPGTDGVGAGASEGGVTGSGVDGGSPVEGSAVEGSLIEGSPGGGSAVDGSPTGQTVSRYRGIRPHVYVSVPVLTLLGHGTEPAILEGYGPIDAETARELTARAPSLTRILTHPETGAILSVGRSSYVVPADLRTWLRIRDHTCRFPGCNQRATSCDVDHSIDWHTNGLAAHDNLAHLCRGHHTLKHHGGWTVKHAGDGTLDWTSPAGRRHLTHPENRLPSGADPGPAFPSGSRSAPGSGSRQSGILTVVRPPSAHPTSSGPPRGTMDSDPPPF